MSEDLAGSSNETVERVVVRGARPADAAALGAIQRQIYAEDRWFVGDRAPTEQALASRLRTATPDSSLWLVAVGADEIVGWLELHRLPAAKLRHVATLTVAVAQAWRGKGLGARLLRGSYRWAERVGVLKISLNVRAGNRSALSLYEREGFVLEGRERDHVRTPDGFEDNLIMARFVIRKDSDGG